VASGEWHRSGRKIPHVHLALESMGAVDPLKVCADLFSYFSKTRGRCRFEVMREAPAATLYALKDTVKGSAHDASSLDLRLRRTRKCGRRS